MKAEITAVVNSEKKLQKHAASGAFGKKEQKRKVLLDWTARNALYKSKKVQRVTAAAYGIYYYHYRPVSEAEKSTLEVCATSMYLRYISLQFCSDAVL